MNDSIAHILVPVFAAVEDSTALREIEYSLPSGLWQWMVCGLGVLAICLIFAVYLKDTAGLAPVWKIWLWGLRFLVLVAVIVIAVNPQERTRKLEFRPSRVVVLIDRSISMSYPATSPVNAGESNATESESRADAVAGLLKKSNLIATLRKNHEVSIYTFDSKLSPAWPVFETRDVRSASSSATSPAVNSGTDDSASTPDEDNLDWSEIVNPNGLETRFGESLIDLIREVNGRTLAGIVVISDGGSNAGIDPMSSRDVAKQSKVRLFTVGVGGTDLPTNLRVANIQAPTDVHLGDVFEISAFLQGQGLEGQQVKVDLLRRLTDENDRPIVVDSKTVTLFEDGLPVEARFERHPLESGEVEYSVRVKTINNLKELRDDDNIRRKSINVIDRPLNVLLIAGGPSRDYRFVRNMLHRHTGIELDVWLQSADAGAAVSQDARKMLLDFPKSRDELFQYDVVIGFDPDWHRLTADQREMLVEWVERQAGGLIVVAGDVHATELADSENNLGSLRDLYPVILQPLLLELQIDSTSRSQQPWPISFTPTGRESGALQLTDNPVASAVTWKEFPGVYRCYPTSGTKAGAEILAYHSNPRMETRQGQPVLLASQFYGAGRVFYFGTTETWRLRAMDEEFHDRLWTKITRDLGQARMTRGSSHGTVLLERTQYYLGQTVRVRANLLDPQFQPLLADSVELKIIGPNGRTMSPPPRLFRDKNRSGQFVGSFRANREGAFRLELSIPGSDELLIKKLDVDVPDLESQNPRQNVQLLRNVVQDTGGAYFSLPQAAAELPQLLPNLGESYLIDETLQALWDRQWLIYLMIGLLSVEWLTRKLLKLA